MKNLGYFQGGVLSIIASFVLIGCNGELKSGHYEGNFLRKINHEVSEESVKIEISRSLKGLNINVKKTNGEGLTWARVSFQDLGRIRINAPLLSKAPLIAHRIKSKPLEKHAKCYATYDSVNAEFCFKKGEFMLRVVDEKHQPYIQLSATRFQKEKPLDLETSRSLTLSEAVQLSFQKNFDSRMSYEKIAQAKYAAVAAYLNLFPHLSMNLIWNASPNFITYLATIQNLAPFLLPSYWLQAGEAVHETRIGKLAHILMKANLVNTVEELTYALVRDSSVLEEQKEFLEKLVHFRGQVSASHLDLSSKEKLLELAWFLNEALTSDVVDLEKLLQQDRFSLAKVLGFHNIEAIQEIQIDHEGVRAEFATLVDPVQTAMDAVNRSFELRQIDEVKKIARLKRAENLFIWLDPSGDPKQGLGLNTFPQQLGAHARNKEIKIQREQMKTTIHQTAHQLALDYNEALKSYQSIKNEIEDEWFDLDQVLMAALSGKPIQLERLKAQAHKFLGYRTAIHTTLANFRIARARKDRYLLAGYYVELLPHLYTSF